MTVHAFHKKPATGNPIPMAEPWRNRAGTFGPCRTMGGDVVAMVYPTPDGRWAWVVNAMGRIQSSGIEQATESESRGSADEHLRKSGFVLN